MVYNMGYQGFYLLVMIGIGLPGQSNSQYYSDATFENVNSAFACENAVAELRCNKTGEVLDVKSFFYGRNKEHGKSICIKNGGKISDCKMKEKEKAIKLESLKKTCNGRRACSIYATDIVFGDFPTCKGVTKYLNIIYDCVIPPPPTNKPPLPTTTPVSYAPLTNNPSKQKGTASPPEDFTIDYHLLDEDGNKWPKPRLVQKCNKTKTTDDDDIPDISIASSIFVNVYVVIVTLVCLYLVV